MSPPAQDAVLPTRTDSPFTLPDARRRLRGTEEPPARLLTMLAVAFLLASPVITVLLALP